jgi:hypothetical protein
MKLTQIAGKKVVAGNPKNISFWEAIKNLYPFVKKHEDPIILWLVDNDINFTTPSAGRYKIAHNPLACKVLTLYSKNGKLVVQPLSGKQEVTVSDKPNELMKIKIYREVK